MKMNDPRVIEKGGKFYIQGSRQMEGLDTGTCAVCGEQYLYRKNKAHADKTKYCDRTCRGKAHQGEGNPYWKGGKFLHPEGYVWVSVYDQDAVSGRRSRRRFEHVLVMEKHLGRPMLPNETIHHKNGDKQDNRIQNLELKIGRHGRGSSPEEMVAWAKEILALYSHLT